MLRCQYEGAIYHVTSRGLERRKIFRSEADREVFLEKLEDCLVQHGVDLYAYTLMSNHFHLLLMTPLGNLSRFMQHFKTSYTVYFNTRHRRVGPLFAGRFKAPLVEGNEYLLKLMRYIHLNPVMVREYEDASATEKWAALRRYAWSSHLAYAGWAGKPPWLRDGPMDSLLRDVTGRKGSTAYRSYVRSGLKTTDDELLEALASSRKGIGSESFRQEVETLYKEEAKKQSSVMDIAMRRVEATIPAETVYQNVCKVFNLPRHWERRRGNRIARDLLIASWMRYSGLTGRQAGQLLGHADGSIVSRRMKWMKQEGNNRRDYRIAIEKLESRMSKVKA